jgi:hypothetical protein
MKKTHVSDFPIIGRQYHNHQVGLRFCAIGSAGRSVGLGTETSVGMSTELSAGSRNIVHFHPVTSKNVNEILGTVKT